MRHTKSEAHILPTCSRKLFWGIFRRNPIYFLFLERSIKMYVFVELLFFGAIRYFKIYLSNSKKKSCGLVVMVQYIPAQLRLAFPPPPSTLMAGSRVLCLFVIIPLSHRSDSVNQTRDGVCSSNLPGHFQAPQYLNGVILRYEYGSIGLCPGYSHIRRTCAIMIRKQLFIFFLQSH